MQKVLRRPRICGLASQRFRDSAAHGASESALLLLFLLGAQILHHIGSLLVQSPERRCRCSN